MDPDTRSRFKGAESILNRSRSLYDGTRYTMRLSSIKSKLQTVSSTLVSSSPFSSVTRDRSSSSLTGSKSGCSERDEAEKRLRERSQQGMQTNPGLQHQDKSGQKPTKSIKKRRRKRDKTKAQNSSRVETVPTPGVTQYPTVIYEVQSGDTLTSVAARFDITPSELCRVNRLVCRSLFPGQQIKVPKLEVDLASGLLTKGEPAGDTNSSTKSDVRAAALTKVNPENQATSASGSVSVETGASSVECDPVDEVFMQSAEHEEESSLSGDYEDGSSARSSEDERDDSYAKPSDRVLEENDPLTAKYLKLDAAYIVNLHSTVPGLLLITTDSLMFTPSDNSTANVDHMHLLLPFKQLRSIAAYADHSVMYFTRRDLQTKCKTSQHQTIPQTKPISDASLTSGNTESSFFADDNKDIYTTAGPDVSVKSEDNSFPRIAITETDGLATCPKDRLRNSTHSVSFTDHLTPGSKLAQKSKSTDFTSPSQSVMFESNPAGSLNNLETSSSAVYLCILAHPTDPTTKRHPHWFTLQSREYWFRIPEDKSELLFDFLLVCDFREDKSTEPPCPPSLSTNDDPIENEVISTRTTPTTETVATLMHIRGSKTTPANLFQCSTSAVVGTKPTVFVVVPNTFDWVLPRIGTVDECSKLMLKRNQRRQRRTHSFRERVRRRGELVVNETKTRPASCTFQDAESVDTSGSDRTRDVFSEPSLQEEKAALQILKQESVRWEWIRAPLRALWNHVESLLVNAAELEEERENLRRREYILNCLQSATPETLPLPRATEHSAILDSSKVRDLMLNLPPDAEGLDWHMTYSTAIHGFSLRTLYYRCAMRNEPEERKSKTMISTTRMLSSTSVSSFSSHEPCLMVIRTVKNEIFGAMLNIHPYANSGRFYGNGSCYVFRWVSPVRSSRKHNTRRRSSCPPPSTTSTTTTITTTTTSQMEVCAIGRPTGTRSKQDLSTERDTMQTSSPPCSREPRDSPCSASSLSDLDSSVLIEKGEEVTEEFARLFFLENDEENEVGNVKDQKKMKFQKYTWTGKNDFFVRGEMDSISIGCSQGHSALHLDDVLLHGRTDACDTFDNEPLCESRDFVVSNLEIWSFR